MYVAFAMVFVFEYAAKNLLSVFVVFCIAALYNSSFRLFDDFFLCSILLIMDNCIYFKFSSVCEPEIKNLLR